eukprot:maker-scaffold_43-snap-gene-0.4-mRNA-1 protein AED:0.00 eAED:0.00 QI:112/1/1/1/1/1/2/85/386
MSAGFLEECEVDTDCIGTLFCYEDLSFSNFSSSCSCHFFYGWEGDKCTEYGPGTVAVIMISAVIAFLSLFYISIISERIYTFLTTDFTKNSRKPRLQNTTSAESSVSVKQMPKTKMQTRNIFLLKAQVLYLILLLSILLFLTNIFYIVAALSPESIRNAGNLKRVKIADVRDWTTIGWIVLYLSAFLQLALSWLHIGYTAAQKGDKLNAVAYFSSRFSRIRLFQVVIVVSFIILTAISPTILYVAAILNIPFYIGSLLYIKKAQKVIQNTLGELRDYEISRQLRLVIECVKSLRISITLLFLSVLGSAFITLVDTELSRSELHFPKPGGINYALLFLQMLRDTGALLMIKEMLLYFDRSSGRKVSTIAAGTLTKTAAPSLKFNESL